MNITIKDEILADVEPVLRKLLAGLHISDRELEAVEALLEAIEKQTADDAGYHSIIPSRIAAAPTVLTQDGHELGGQLAAE